MNVPEERLFFDVLGVALAGSQASLRILAQQLPIQSEIGICSIVRLDK